LRRVLIPQLGPYRLEGGVDRPLHRRTQSAADAEALALDPDHHEASRQPPQGTRQLDRVGHAKVMSGRSAQGARQRLRAGIEAEDRPRGGPAGADRVDEHDPLGSRPGAEQVDTLALVQVNLKPSVSGQPPRDLEAGAVVTPQRAADADD
jgi:hypothetical protein